MKTGAGDDPFADLTEDEAADEADATTDEAAESASASDPEGESATAAEPAAADAETTATPTKAEIPWVLRRQSVKDDRPNVTQFFLRDETDRAERRFHNEVEELLDTDVYTLDLREAAYLVAMQHPEEVVDTLQSWGYDYLE